jgi:hypothetical protein
MLTAYFDVGGHADDDKVKALAAAGFIAPTDDWILIEQRWKEVLSKYGVSALHMREFAHSRGEYETWKGKELHRARFIFDLISVLKPLVRNSFASAIDLVEYRRVDSQYGVRTIFPPLAMVGCRCVRNVLAWAHSWSTPRDNLLILFENGDEGRGKFSDICKQTYGIRPSFEEKISSVAFEAADLLAYENLLLTPRFFEGTDVMVDIQDIRKSMQALHGIPHQTRDGIDTWVMYERPHIEAGFKNLLKTLGSKDSSR